MNYVFHYFMRRCYICITNFFTRLSFICFFPLYCAVKYVYIASRQLSRIFNKLKSSAVFLFCEIHSPESMVCCKSILVDVYLIFFFFFSNCSFSSCSYFLHIFPLLLNIFHCKKKLSMSKFVLVHILPRLS